jgi:hypothetical protein
LAKLIAAGIGYALIAKNMDTVVGKVWLKAERKNIYRNTIILVRNKIL